MFGAPHHHFTTRQPRATIFRRASRNTSYRCLVPRRPWSFLRPWRDRADVVWGCDPFGRSSKKNCGKCWVDFLFDSQEIWVKPKKNKKKGWWSSWGRSWWVQNRFLVTKKVQCSEATEGLVDLEMGFPWKGFSGFELQCLLMSGLTVTLPKNNMVGLPKRNVFQVTMLVSGSVPC